MPVDERNRRQVELLVRTLPHVAQERCFALKGGTAINLFVRNLPRLSVDIDLTFLPVADRARSLADIEAALRRIAERIEGALPVARVQTGVLKEEGTVNKLFVRERGTRIKIEVTPVLRGCGVRGGGEGGVGGGRGAVRLCRHTGGFVPGPVRRQAGGGSRSPTSARPVRCPWPAVERRDRRRAPHRLHRLSGEPSSTDREVAGAAAPGHARKSSSAVWRG